MKWIKKGLIYQVKKNLYWNQSHAQVPTAIKIGEDIVRIYYSTRDSDNRSHTSFIDVKASNPQEVLFEYDKPVLDLGKTGCFDDSGVMPTWVEKVGDEFYLYYIGWNVGHPARYRVANGLAISKDGGFTFTRYSNGPMLDRSFFDPIAVAMHSILREEGIWKMWYMSYTKWVKIGEIFEPYYIIKYAESEDGINWHPKDIICIDLTGEHEGGIARPFVRKSNNIYQMWYSYRKGNDYRNTIENSYRIGYAESLDGLSWERKDRNSEIALSTEGWDSEMIAYPNLYTHKGNIFMLYNGNGFGKSGFGYAVLSEV
jgi:hypothetical protein